MFCRERSENMCTDKVFTLRPHHGMCLAYFRGEGYSDRFSWHMKKMLDTFQNGTVVKLCVSTDEICSVCPNNLEGVCVSHSLTERYDRQVLEFCGFSQDEIMPFYEFVRQVEGKILSAKRRKEICGDCQWNSICESQPSRWKSNEVT